MSIIDIISAVTTANFAEDKKKFLYCFERLYSLDIFVPTLNLITSKALKHKASFSVEPLKQWDRIQGHCQTSGFFNKITGMFEKENKIVIKTIEPDIIIHEIAHAIEKESKIDLNGDFRKAIGLDLKDRIPDSPQVYAAVTKIMRDDLKGYELNNIMEELFARYFEILAYSVEVKGWRAYQFKYSDISGFLINTTSWVEKYLNPLLEKLTDGNVKIEGNNFAKTIQENEYKKQWTQDIKSTRSDKNIVREGGNSGFSSRIASSNDWLKSWQAFSGNSDVQKLEEDKKYIEDN